jgi:hypothetical protein
VHINHRGLAHLAPANIASTAVCSASLASSILRCLCRSLRCRSFSFLLTAAGCCVSLAAAPAEGSTACDASTVLRRPALAGGSVLGRLPSPRDVHASPLLLPAAAALLDGPPPDAVLPAFAFPLPFCCAPPPERTPRTKWRGAATGTPQPEPRYSLPTRALETPRHSPTHGR